MTGKIKYLLTTTLLFSFGLSCFAGAHKRDKTKGFHFVPFPALSYNSDQGLLLGGKLDVYNYGDGSNYPNYHDRILADFQWATKGAMHVHLYYDSPKLIKNHRLTLACTYKIHNLYPFMGFNGKASPYFHSLDLNQENRTAFYSIKSNMLRCMATIQGKIHGPLKWAAGLTLWKYDIADIKNKNYDSGNSLFNEYVQAGIIRPEEKSGGTHLEFKAGITYDNRDFELNPSRGIWFESYLYGSKDFFRHHNDYLKLAVHFRHYVPIFQDRLTFAYHLAYQDLLAGSCPFYLNQEIATILLRQIETDGLGGVNTVRGILLNRMVGNGYAWGNFEFRAKLFEFNLLGQHFDFGINPLFDMGMVVRPYRLEEMKATRNPVIYSGDKEKMHFSAGCGIKINMNYNLTLSAEIARPISRQDGPYGLNMSMNYLF